MARFANELREHIIRPTLKYLGVENPNAEALLLTLALLSSRFRCDDDRLGVYCIAPQQHRQVWDDYLAFQPNLASEVRALASQRWFLENPDRELIANVAYASAIAWILFSTSGMTLPDAADVEAQAKIWQRLFGAHMADSASLKQAIDWVLDRLHRNPPPAPAVANLR